MADRRKLQGEIDRCLKKVSEGVEIFEDIWKKVQQATNSNQKEKYETDLKREIKKLQRLRDQIKSWVANSDIKDKSTLLDHRKLIETQMERFKVVERETKTKAYSKEGLGAAAKLDPQTKEKGEITNWLSHMIDELNVQLDQFECELEQLSCTSKKKKLEHERLDELKSWQDKHKDHIHKLEMVMRMVDNDAITPEQIKKIKDDVEYYVESNQEPDFEINEFVYDDLDLEEIGAALQASSPPENEDAEKLMMMNATTPTSTNSSSPSPSPSVNHSMGSAQSEDKSDDGDRKRHRSQSDEKVRANQSSTPTLSSNLKVQITPSRQLTQSNVHSQNSDSTNQPTASTPPLAAYSAAAAAASNQQNSASGNPIPRLSHSIHSVWGQRNAPAHNSFHQDGKTTSNSIDHVAAASSASSNGTLNAGSNSINAVCALNSSGNPSVPSAPSPLLSGAAASMSPVGSTNTTASSTLNVSSQQMKQKPEAPVSMNGPHRAGGSSIQSPESMSSLKSMAQQAIVEAGLESQLPTSPPTTNTKGGFLNSTPQAPPQPTAPSPEQPLPNQQSATSSTTQQQSVHQQQQHPPHQQTPQTTTIHLNPLLGIAPLGPMPLSKEHIFQLSMLDAAFHHLPHPSDSERLRLYLPRNPCPTPSYYPEVPPHQANSEEFFHRLSTEALFFIFYYMEGTKAQYLAAKALKRQSWRFHTKYMLWFQRHEEPKIITEDYEQGTYIYFDNERWGQRKKEGFYFEYRYLEDRHLN